MKKALLIIISLLALFILSSCKETAENPTEQTEKCYSHTDTNADSKCDVCGDTTNNDSEKECTDHKDENSDKTCDNCGMALEDDITDCTEHKDEDGDGRCDVCDAEIIIEVPKENSAILIENGECKFSIVLASGYSSDVNKEVALFVRELEKLGASVEILEDSISTLSEVEVLIGNVKTRGEDYQIDEHTLGYNGYAIRIINGKVLILAGSEDALIEAIAAFKKDILGITKKSDSLADVSMTPDMNIEMSENYTVKSVTVGGNDFCEYVITTDSDNSTASATAEKVQKNLYKKLGIWLPILSGEALEKKRIDITLTTPKTCTSDKGFIVKVEDGNILIDCGFENRLEDAVTGFIFSHFTSVTDDEITISEGYVYEKEDYKNIYYKDYGAKGDGISDDFFAIKACHDEANEYGHTVHADENATYYFGYGSGYNTIEIRTDTYWHGCSFIFNDSEIKAPSATGERGDGEFYTSIFSVNSENTAITYTDSASMPIKSLEKSAENIGFAPGYRALITVYNSDIKHYIRYGKNQNSGDPQHEIVVVDAEGNIDPKTPLRWSYERITKLEIINVEDEAILISGGEGEEKTHINTIANLSPTVMAWYQRNIHITRSNVTITNVKHTLSEESAELGVPYQGLVRTTYCENVTVDGFEFQRHLTHSTTGGAGVTVGLGTYEISADHAASITWKRCTQSNFFNEDGSISRAGIMGTSRCKDLTFDTMFVCSFDAHCGLYGVTIKDTEIEHINLIGAGPAVFERVRVHANAGRSAMVLRPDYGSTWEGDIIISDLEVLYYSTSMIELIENEWVNHYFGYTTYLPKNIYINNVSTVKIGFEVDDEGVRHEWEIERNAMPLRLASRLESYTSVNIGDPDEILENYPTSDAISCSCSDGFSDTDGDGRCNNYGCGLHESASIYQNRNPYMPIENIYITNSPGLTLILPKTPQFDKTKVFVEGTEIFWRGLDEIYID